MADNVRKPSKMLDTAIARTRLDIGLNGLLFIAYAPVGFLLAAFRAFLMLQAILILVVVAEGFLKRLMLKVIFFVMGIVVTTSEFEKRESKVKILVGNKLSFIDYIALHLALECYTVNTGDEWNSPLMAAFPHHTFHCKEGDGLLTEARERPMFDEEGMGPISYAVQPEIHPTNGCSVLLPFSSWPFVLEQSVQPFALSATRLFGPTLTVAGSNEWWDLFWTLLSPVTVFHIKMLPVIRRSSDTDTAENFSNQVAQEVAKSLGLHVSTITPTEFNQWLSKPPAPSPKPPSPESSPMAATVTSQGPIITAAEFASLPQSYPSGMEMMVQQVATVLPHVPLPVIRKDLLKTKSVDDTIANILEGQVAFVPLPQGVSGGTSTPARSAPSLPPPRPSPSRSSLQRHVSLEERKKTLIAEAKRRYLEKHKPSERRDSSS